MKPEEIQQILAAISLQDINIVNSSLEVKDTFIPRLSDESILRARARQSHLGCDLIEADASINNEPNQKLLLLRSYVEFEAQIYPVGENETAEEGDELSEKVVVTIFVKYVLDYKVSDEDILEAKESVVEFMEKHSVHSVWPYWREYMHQSCDRVGLKRLTVPHKAPPAAPVEQEKED